MPGWPFWTGHFYSPSVSLDTSCLTLLLCSAPHSLFVHDLVSSAVSVFISPLCLSLSLLKSKSLCFSVWSLWMGGKCENIAHFFYQTHLFISFADEVVYKDNTFLSVYLYTQRTFIFLTKTVEELFSWQESSESSLCASGPKSCWLSGSEESRLHRPTWNIYLFCDAFSIPLRANMSVSQSY